MIKLNNLIGWGMFSIALLVYYLTTEPTASLWDCGEFIACAYKLQVPHPPGAPLYLMLGRLFALLAGSNTEKVAFFVNLLSVIASALTIMLLYWTIVMIGRKTIGKPFAKLNKSEWILLYVAGIVGSLAFAFSDTFWFSAVEAEVYAMSSFLIALMVWMAFKWELIEDEAQANRWIVLVAYIIGLSIGVHLLNLVAIPALALVYYFKKYPNANYRGSILSIVVGLIVLGIINVGVIAGLPTLAFQSELFWVNIVGLPYMSGVVVFLFILIGILYATLRYSIQKQLVMVNVATLCFVFVLIGYQSYNLALVRSSFNPPINENNPSNILNYLKYLKREQYEQRALLYGPTYASELESIDKGEPMYQLKDGKYKVYDYKQKLNYAKGDEMLFPRIYTSNPDHAAVFEQLLEKPKGAKPTMGDNLQYFFINQLSQGYMRYFLWNFVSRESDYQDAGTIKWRHKASLPYRIAQNKAHNNYWMLPLLLGVLGFWLLYHKNAKDLAVTSLLFLFTGLALVVFLNASPIEPRERDYIYVGSFYFFTIWIGVGALQLYTILQKILKKTTPTLIGTASLSMFVPIILLQQNYDDHDRSNRFYQVDFAKNVLNSCEKNAILFTGGDNDTFGLWYAQEVEGFRTDVRVCNVSLLSADWYIEQMRRKTYQSEGIDISLKAEQLQEGQNGQILFYENPSVKNGINLQEYLKLVQEDNPAIKVPLQDGSSINTLPSEILYLPIEPEKVRANIKIAAQFEPLISNQIEWNIGKEGIYKAELIQLDIIAQNAKNAWKRPIYFASGLQGRNFLNMKEFMQMEGLAYRLMPFKVQGATEGFANSEMMYDTLMRKSTWRELNNPKVYYQTDFYAFPVYQTRLNFLRLSEQLVYEKNFKRANEVLDFALGTIPDTCIPFDHLVANFIPLYLGMGQDKKALHLAEQLVNREKHDFDYFVEQHDSRNIQMSLYILQIIVESYKRYNKPEWKKYEQVLHRNLQILNI